MHKNYNNSTYNLFKIKINFLNTWKIVKIKLNKFNQKLLIVKLKFSKNKNNKWSEQIKLLNLKFPKYSKLLIRWI